MSATADIRQKSPFAPIRVAAGAFDDPRLRIAARLLRVSFEKLFFRLQKLWSWVTAQQSETLHELVIAEALGRRDTQALATALCHPAVQLADRDEDGYMSLYLHDLFGATEWYADYRARAPAAGDVRAAHATRHRDGTFARRDLQAEVMSALGAGAMRRSHLRTQLRCRKKAVCDAVKALLATSAIEELEGGYLRIRDAGANASPGPAGGSLAGSAGSRVPAEPVPPSPRGTQGTTPEPSAPAPAPAPAPAGEGAPAPARMYAIPAAPLDIEHAGPIAMRALTDDLPTAETENASSRAEVRVPRAHSASDAVVVKHPASERRDMLERLAARYEQLGQELEPDWRSQSAARRVRQLNAVCRPDQGISESAIQHAMEMLAVEARERRELGDPDPTRWYRAAWSPGVFQRALDLPNEKAARHVARTEQGRTPHAEPRRTTLADQLARQRAAGEHT